jgi:predicted kinase
LTIFDCIEFSADFRCIDVADELAFLAAECDFLGADWIGSQLVKAYQTQSGDRPPDVLLDFYKSYRACVRAKVAALRADQLRGAAHESAVAEAHGHLALADRYVSTWVRPLVVAIGGMAGTGKSTLAKELAGRLGAELLRTDAIRQELYGSGPHPAGCDEGIYGQQARERVYDAMFRQAAALAADHISVVLDGTFSTVSSLKRAHQIAARPRDLFLAVECVCRTEVAHQRINKRLAEGRDVSDARPEIHELQRMRWEARPPDMPIIRVDTERPLENQVTQVIGALTRLATSWPDAV